MADTFDAHVTEDQLVKLLQNGFAGGIVKSLTLQLQEELQTRVNALQAEYEKLIEAEVAKVVKAYTAHSVGIHQSPHSMQPVINIVINHQVKEVRHEQN